MKDVYKNKLHILKLGATAPTKVGNIKGELLLENGAYHFVDMSTVIGKDHRRGYNFCLKDLKESFPQKFVCL